MLIYGGYQSCTRPGRQIFRRGHAAMPLGDEFKLRVVWLPGEGYGVLPDPGCPPDFASPKKSPVG
jgi:hypothetical protein